MKDTTSPRPDKDNKRSIEEEQPHGSEEIDAELLSEHESIPEEMCERVLDRDNHQCQTKGCLGVQRGGSAQLLVQRIAMNPEGYDKNDLQNLTTRCLHCSRWLAKMPGREDLSPVLKRRLNGVDIKGTWAEILQYLYNEGPSTTGEITDAVSLSSQVGVRRALYAMMSLDIREQSIDEQIVVKDRTNGTYGLPEQIPTANGARGVVPLQPSKRRTRILDEVVRRVLDQISEDIENPREVVADIVDRDPHQTRHMKRRAEAFKFPFEQWGDTKRPRQDAAAAIEAVDVLAGATDNVSRQLLSTAIAEIFESHDEAAVAKLLQQWVNGDDYHTSPLLNQDADEVIAGEKEQSEGDNTGEDSQVRGVFEHTNTVNSQNSTTDNQEFTEVEQQWTDVANYE